jgi:glycosyltransferase involved in cell wall biosynthesis
MFDSETYKRIFTKEKKPMHAAVKYHSLLSKGLAENGVFVNTYSSLPANRENCERLYVSSPAKIEGNLKTQYIASFNLPVIRQLQLMLKSFFKALFMPKDTVVLYDALVVSAAYGAVMGAKLSGKGCVAILTDLPKYMPIAQDEKMLRLNEKLIEKADGYVFLTEQMNETLNGAGKPYVVLEGHVDTAMTAKEHLQFSDDKKKVLYAGTLKKIYGIKNLCEAFAAASNENEELHIYGDGDYAPELAKLIVEHPNIVYHGNCLNEVVVEAELDCSLLVNPRPTEGEYTKFSFPSKTLEYMVSGTPVLSAKLQGIPTEYDEYLYYFDDKSEDGLQNALRAILDKPSTELCERGRASRQFALEKKNNISQAMHVIELCKTVAEN